MSKTALGEIVITLFKRQSLNMPQFSHWFQLKLIVHDDILIAPCFYSYINLHKLIVTYNID